MQAVNIDTNVVYPTKTNGVGAVPRSLHCLRGRYRMHVKREGFKDINLTGMELHTQDVLQQNFALEVGSTSESVTVEATSTNINTTDASVSTVIDRQFVENMPLNGRSFQDLLTLVPGVVEVPGSGYYGPGGGARSRSTASGPRRTISLWME